jgi:hypothetical protein
MILSGSQWELGGFPDVGRPNTQNKDSLVIRASVLRTVGEFVDSLMIELRRIDGFWINGNQSLDGKRNV